jgi:hypothetical protein
MESSLGSSLAAVHFSIGSTKIPAAVRRPIPQARCSLKSTSVEEKMRGSCRTLIGWEASGIGAFRDSLRKSQHLVRGVVRHAGQARPLDPDLRALPWGGMVAPDRAA